MPRSASYLHDIYDELAGSIPNDIAVVCARSDRQCLTYAAVRERSLLLAGGLIQYVAPAVAGEKQTIAVHLPRTHPDFVPLLVAASRVGSPFVLLSTDLPDGGLQDARNVFALELLKPRLYISASQIFPGSLAAALRTLPNCSFATIGDLVGGSAQFVGGANVELRADILWYGGANVELCADILCFMFTGGTSRTKVVQVTHAMVLHERVAYADLWQPSGRQAAVLAHTSVYWGASALGQLSIALACKGRVVWTEASEVGDLRRCIADEHVNVLGVVPDHLDLLAPVSPSQELPDIEVVFTWGERLPQRTADRWRDHPRAVLRELLISTEYWLSLWCDPLGDRALRTARNTKLLILKDDGGEAAVGEIGELMIAGSMVMSGYYGDIGDAPEPFFDFGGVRFFRTRDLVRRVPEGIIYKGRADMMTKYKGKWVDMIVIEEQLCQLDGVQAAKVIPDTVGEHFHAFVALDQSRPAGPIITKVRLCLPPRIQLWLVQELPRHPVTRKVDVGRLSKVLVGETPSWPVAENATLTNAPPVLWERLSTMFYGQLCWQLAAFGIAWAVADGSELLFQTTLIAVYIPAMLLVDRNLTDDSGRLIVMIVLTLTWVLAVVLGQPLVLGQPPSLIRIARSMLSLTNFTYSFLTMTYADSDRATSFAARATMAVVDECPFWKLGAFILFSLGQHLPGHFGTANLAVLVAYSFVGAVFAVWRGRLIAWPVMFWTVGVGSRLHRDCDRWVEPSFWYRNTYSQLMRVWYAGAVVLQPFAFLRKMFEGRPATYTEQTWPDRGPLSCSSCMMTFAHTQYPAHDENGRVVCTPCGSKVCANAEAAAAEWLATICSQPQAEPMRKVRRIDAVSNVDPPKENIIQETNRYTKYGGEEKPYTEEQKNNWRRKQSENWWWKNKTADTFDLDAEQEQRMIDLFSAGVQSTPVQVPPHMQLLCNIIGEIEPFLKPVHGGTVLIGIDSLQVARLSNAFRVQLGVSLSIQQLRDAQTVAVLADVLAKTKATAAKEEPSPDLPASSDTNQEYAVWYSPGQYKAMGYWVLRTDEKLDHSAFVRAAQKLVDRHEALRCIAADPLRYTSLLYDAAVCFTLYAPFLMRGPAFFQFLRRQISEAFTHCWPRIRTYGREEFYAKRFPETLSPVEILQVPGGQKELERVLRTRRSRMAPPGIITAYELDCYLADVWAFDSPGWKGRIVILAAPEQFSDPEGSGLVYIDINFKEWGPLIGPGSSKWEVPPYGFPALFFIPLSSGALAWIRLDGKDELRICYREQASRSTKNRKLIAYRATPDRGRDCHPPVTVNFLSVGMFHSFADGNCYLPLVQDFCMLYDTARGIASPQLPAIPSAFKELERRLFDTFHCRAAPMRASLRGSLFGYQGHGYGYILGIAPGAISAVTRVAVQYRVPLDVALLGIVCCAMARADQSDFCDFTLYTPMRDGAAEASTVALFSDWRDLYVSMDFDLATMLGTVLQLGHKIQHRQWTVFNALRKPERIVVNIQPLDFQKRAGFKNLGENMWRDGDRLNENDERPNEMQYAAQPATFVIEQQDEETWWILASAGNAERPAPWMRRFVESFRDALSCFLFEPLAKVHRELPDDDALLASCANVGKPICLSAPK